MLSDPEEDCITLEALSEDDFNHNEPQAQQELSISWRISGLMTAWKTKCAYLSVADPTISGRHSEDLVADPANSLSWDTAPDWVSPSSLGKCSSSVDEEQLPTKKQKRNFEAGCTVKKERLFWLNLVTSVSSCLHALLNTVSPAAYFGFQTY